MAKWELDVFTEIDVFLDEIGPIVDGCLDVIQKSGTNAKDAENVPNFLYKAILYHNRSTMGTTPFKTHFEDD